MPKKLLSIAYLQRQPEPGCIVNFLTKQHVKEVFQIVAINKKQEMVDFWNALQNSVLLQSVAYFNENIARVEQVGTVKASLATDR